MLDTMGGMEGTMMTEHICPLGDYCVRGDLSHRPVRIKERREPVAER